MAQGLQGEPASPPRMRPGPSPQVACQRCLDSLPAAPYGSSEGDVIIPRNPRALPAQFCLVRMNPAIFGTHRGQRNRLHHAKRQKRARCDRTSRVPCLAFADTRARRAFSGRIGEHEDPRFPASTERTESSRRPTRERNRHSARVVDSLRFLDLSLLRSFGTMHLSIRFFLSGPRSLTRPFSFSLRPGRPQSRPGFFLPRLPRGNLDKICVTFSYRLSTHRRAAEHSSSCRARATSGRHASALKRESPFCIRVASLPCSSGSAPYLTSRHLFAPHGEVFLSKAIAKAAPF